MWMVKCCHMSRWNDITGSKCCSLYLNLTHCSSLRGWVCGGPPCHQLKPREDTTSVIFPTDLSKACFTSSTPSTEPYRLGESQTIQNQWDLKLTRVAKITLKKNYKGRRYLPTFPTKVVRLLFVLGETNPLSFSNLLLSLEITATLKPKPHIQCKKSYLCNKMYFYKLKKNV